MKFKKLYLTAMHVMQEHEVNYGNQQTGISAECDQYSSTQENSGPEFIKSEIKNTYTCET